MLRSRRFWESRPLHPVARPLLLAVVGVLVLLAVSFTVGAGEFTRYDLVAVAMYVGLAAFVWHPVTAAFIVMLVGSVGVVFTGSGGDLIELALGMCLVAATCSRGVIVTYAALLVTLTVYLDTTTTTLTDGGILGIAGIAAICFIAGTTFRLVTVRETLLIAERARLVKDLEDVAREDQEQIADELHDGIAHDLTLVLFHARALPKQPDAAGRQVSLSTIEESAERALHSIQSLLSLMRDPGAGEAPPDEARLGGDLVETVTGLATLLDDAGIPTRVSVPEAHLDLSSVSERLLGATAVEAITNIIKHAPHAQSAAITVQCSADHVELVIESVTKTAAITRTATLGGRGLSRARQRLEQNGGRLKSGPTDTGWVVDASVPIRIR